MVVLKKSKGKKVKGKRKNMRGGAFDGIYEFTNYNDEIYFFSDLEGNMPDGIKELMFETTFEMDGIIEKPKSLENKVIVFTGDLIDRGEYSIRNLRRMLALKEKIENEGRVILLCGNRDTNKIRMYHECHIKAIEDKILNNADKEFNKEIKIAGIISKLKDISVTPDNLFTNKSKDIATIINITGILKDLTIPNTDDPNFVDKYTDDISRIEKMYLNTLGSPKQVENFKKEFKVLFGIGEIGNVFEEDKITLLKFIAMMNMVMGKIWDNNVLPKILEPYNGMYIKYLQQCHIMAIITIGDKLCLVSHAGIPYKEKVIGDDSVIAENEGSFYIPLEIGKVILPVQEHKIINDVATNIGTKKFTRSHYYNIDKICILNRRFTEFINNKNTSETDYKKYVAMSANCDIQSIDGTEFSAYASPIVSRKNIEEVKDKKNLSLYEFIKEGALTTKVYNIFGHQPSGVLPYISKKEEVRRNGVTITSYHIDLDISKVEDNDISNKESYVYLKMTKDSDMLFGKTNSTKEHDIINKSESRKKIKDPPLFIDNYKDVTLDSYCENSRVDVTYNINTSTLFTVDDIRKEEIKYYGMFSFTLVETNKDIKPNTDIETGFSSNGGRGKTTIYAKSIRRFLYGKRKMVIYVGKRGGEYVKVKGEYMSLAKFNKKINNKK